MNTRELRSRRPLGIECLEGRVALSGGLAPLASAAHVEHAKVHHAEVEMHKGVEAEHGGGHHANDATVEAGMHQADDPASHDANDDKGGVGEAGHRGGGKDDATGHKGLERIKLFRIL